MKIGDKFVCTCGSCDNEVYTIVDEYHLDWKVRRLSGSFDYFDKATPFIVPESVYNSKLYKALK